MADEDTINARHRIAAASGAALLVGGLILVAAVLPAEYGIDPLGTGAKLGLLELGKTGQQVRALEDASAAQGAAAATVVAQTRPFHEETVTFTIGPRQFMEYKYRLEKGEALLYSWRTPVAVPYEFHAEPDGAPAGYAQTYDKATARESSGTLTAPFAGIHGWYWENPTDQAITVTLTAAGFYNLSHEFRVNEPVKNRTFD